MSNMKTIDVMGLFGALNAAKPDDEIKLSDYEVKGEEEGNKTMSLFSKFAQAEYLGPVIQINNEYELKKLQELAKKNNFFYYETFCKRTYNEILHLLEINYRGKDFNKDTNNGKSFLVEYSYGQRGLTFAVLSGYDEDRINPNEWEIIQMSDVLKELGE